MGKKSNAARFPLARIKKMIQADEDVGKVAQATPIVVSKALELFLTNLVEACVKDAEARGSQKLTPYGLKRAINTTATLDFCADLVESIPDPIEDEEGGGDENEEGGKKKRRRTTASTAEGGGKSTTSRKGKGTATGGGGGRGGCKKSKAKDDFIDDEEEDDEDVPYDEGEDEGDDYESKPQVQQGGASTSRMKKGDSDDEDYE